MSLNASSASSRKALLTQRCAPLLARLLLLEARAAVPWLPGPRGGRRGLAAAHPIQPPRLRGANLALWVDALRCPPLSTALRCSTRKPPLARSRTSGSLIGVPTKPGFDPKGGLRRQGLLCRGSQGFARRPRRGDELPRPRPRQRRALAGAARKPQQFRLPQLSGCGAFRRGIVTNRRFAVHPRCARFFGRSSDP